MTDEDQLAVFRRGGAIDVPVDKIESSLTALWRAASQQKSEPIVRACLWNLVVRVAGEERFVYAKKLIDDVSAQVPARAIVWREERDGDTEIRAQVEANWRHAGGNALSGSDEVTLTARGAASARVPSLVRSLLVADAPTALFWVGAPPLDGELLDDADRLVVDSRKFDSERALCDLARTAATPSVDVVDLSWLGVSPLRGLLAALFDHDPHPLFGMERVTVASGVRGTQTRALLTLGWLASRLGWSAPAAVEADPDRRRWKARRGDGGEVLLELVTLDGGADHGVAEIALDAGGRTWQLRRDQHCIDVHAPDLPPRHQPARSHSDAELTQKALGPRGRDPVFRDALAAAAQLIEAQGS